MARIPWSPSPTRNTPIAASGGTIVKFALPIEINSGGDGWAMILATPTVNRAVADTTLVFNTPISTSAETGAHSTTSRLRGLWMRHASQLYEITAQTTTTITFTPGLVDAMTGDETIFGIQSDLPPLLSFLLVRTDGVNLKWGFQKTLPANEDGMATLLNGQSETIVNSDSPGGCVAKPLWLIGEVGAGTVETRIFSA